MKIATFCLSLIITSLPLSTKSIASELCALEQMESQQIYECSKRAATDSDEALNSAYKKLNQQITADYKGDPIQGKKLLDHIIKSQRIWIDLRDENCAIENFLISPGTQAFDTTRNFCFARESTERTEYLQGLRF